ncbi:MAG: PadR family transcriptional regulator [Candidatus Dormibacteraceae bacterium]
MREPSYFILTVLLERPLHGYAIIRRAFELSHGHLRLSTGTLYANLDRLLDTHLIEVDRDEVVEGRARRTYRISGAGREAVRAQARLLSEAASLVLKPSAGDIR